MVHHLSASHVSYSGARQNFGFDYAQTTKQAAELALMASSFSIFDDAIMTNTWRNCLAGVQTLHLRDVKQASHEGRNLLESSESAPAAAGLLTEMK